MSAKKELSFDQKIDFLKNVALFSELRNDDDAMNAIAAVLHEQSFTKGQTLLAEGSMGSEMYFLCKGKVSIFKHTTQGDEYRLGILESNQYPFFGEGAVLDTDSRSASIRADEDCQCLILTREVFVQFGKKNPHWAFPLLVSISRAVMARLRKTNQEMLLLYHALVQEIRG